MALLLIRHGETALNAARVLQPADTCLSARGVEQAEALARRLASMGVAAIISSDLPRALRTAAAIATATGAPIETSALLQERNYGDWRGRPYDGLEADPLTMQEAPPGGESAAAFAQRVARAFAHLVQRHSTVRGNLAIVTHGLVIRALLATHTRLLEGMPPRTHLSNTGLSIVEAQPPHRATLLNCTRHLEPATRDAAGALSGG